jgi:tetratricopeptide (TPR) repeat protein
LIRLDTQNPDALYLRARVFYSQGDNQKTAAHCMEALRCDPDFSKARSLLKMSRAIEAQKDAGNTAFKLNKLDEAYEAYTAALEIDPKNDHMNARLYSNRAAVLQKVKIDKREVLCAYRMNSKKNLKRHYLIVIKQSNWMVNFIRHTVDVQHVLWKQKNTKKPLEIIKN